MQLGFSDLEEKIEHLLSYSKERCTVAREAQEAYRRYLFGKGRAEFCDRICEITERHMPFS